MVVFEILVLVDDPNVVFSELLNAWDDSGDELSQAPSSIIDSGPGEHSDVNRLHGTIDNLTLLFPGSILSIALVILSCSSIILCKYLP